MLPAEPTRILTPEEQALLDEQAALALAAQQAAVPPPAALVPAGTPAPPTQTIDYPTAGPQGNVAQPYDYGIPVPAAAPVPAPAPAAPMAASTYYGGAAESVPPISTGLIETRYPSTGAPATSRVVPSDPRAAQDAARARRFAGSAERWAAHPVERRPIPPGASGFNTGSVPGGPGDFWRRTPAELSAFRSRYRLEHPPASTPPSVDSRGTPRRPAAAIVAPVPLPVAQAPSPVDVFRAWWEAQGLWPHYRTRLQDDLGAPLRGGGPPRSG